MTPHDLADLLQGFALIGRADLQPVLLDAVAAAIRAGRFDR